MACKHTHDNLHHTWLSAAISTKIFLWLLSKETKHSTQPSAEGSLYEPVLFKLLFGLRPLTSVKHLETIISGTDAMDKDSLKYIKSNVIEA